MHTVLTFARRPAAAAALCGAALLAACGGGGDGTDANLSNEAATTAAANATLMASDATAAVDAGVLAAQAVVSTQATVAGGMTALAASTGESGSAQPSAVANVAVACPGGGGAVLSISGGTAASLLNGQLDTGEVYQLVFTGCRGALGAVQVSGTLALTVDAATASSLALSTVATGLVVALPRGTVTLQGSTARQVGVSTLAGGGTELSSRFSSAGFTMGTQFNSRISSFTLSAVDITRQSTWVNGVLQASSINGTHTLAATLPGGAFSHTVSTQGSVSYSASGMPTAGSWTITLPNARLGVSVANNIATITVDEGKDGTIDRTFTVPISRLQSDAG